MPPLSSEQMNQIREQLGAARRALLAEVSEALDNTENQRYVDIIGRPPADSGDASVSDELADLNLTMLDRHISQLRAIEQTEQRMQDQTYGECVNCGGEIAFERLLAQPTAVRCVVCQDMYEKTHVSQATPSL